MPPEPPPKSLAPRRSLRLTFAVAQRKLGPTSSATISTTLRLSPLSVSQLRCSSRPVTTTREPLPMRLGDVLGHLTPAHDVEEARLLFPFLGLAVLPPAAHGDAEARLGCASGGVTDLGIASEVPDDRDGAVCHGLPPYASVASFAASATGPAPIGSGSGSGASAGSVAELDGSGVGAGSGAGRDCRSGVLPANFP